MALKTRDYTLTGPKGLETEEQLMELNWAKEDFAAKLFKDDLQKARMKNLNITRIIRFKFHDWVEELCQTL